MILQVEHTLKGNGHMGAITSISWDKATTLYTTGEDCMVIVWDLTKGSSTGQWNTPNERLTCLNVTESTGKIITASRQVRIWVSSTRQCEQTLTGHTSTVTHLRTFAVDGADYAISASKTDRNISMWDLGSTKKESLGTFILDDLVDSVDVKVHEMIVYIVASTRNGLVHLFSEKLEKIKTTVKPLKARWKVSFVSDDKKTALALPVIGTKFTSTADKISIQIAYGGAGCLRFEVVTPKREEKHEVIIRDDPRKVKRGTEISGKHIQVDPSNVDYALGGEVKKSKKAIEIPIEKRLENLMFSKNHKGSSGMVPSKNMHYLIQALHSRDTR